MSEFQPSRQQSDLADVIELLLDKGVVINADIAVSIGDTQLLGIQIRAAIASFDTAARYGLEFPEGTDMRRMAEAVGDPEIAEMDRPKPPVNPVSGVNVTSDEEVSSDDESGDSEAADTDTESPDSTDGNEGNAENEDGGSGLVGDDDRGSERLGARPDPERPGEGDLDLLSDGGDDDEVRTGTDGDEGRATDGGKEREVDGDEGRETDDERTAEADDR